MAVPRSGVGIESWEPMITGYRREEFRILVLGKRALASDWSAFASNNVVALDYRGDPNRFVLIVLLLIHPNHASVGSHEYFGSTRNFSRQSKGEIYFGSGSEIFLHHEINAAGGNVARLAVMSRGFTIDW